MPDSKTPTTTFSPGDRVTHALQVARPDTRQEGRVIEEITRRSSAGTTVTYSVRFTTVSNYSSPSVSEIECDAADLRPVPVADAKAA